MGRRGPPPKPTALKRLSGSWRADINQNEPEPPAGVPIAPDFLCDEALRYWNKLVPMLNEMGLLTMADGDTLAIYCQSLARLAECERIINQHGPTYTTYKPDGSLSMIKMRPEASLAKELYTTVNRLGKEFGLSPSARAHLNVQDAKPVTKSEKEKLFDVG